jgi:4-phytase / acid phosphatase
MRILIATIAALVTVLASPPPPAHAGDVELEAVVLFSRHGVRAPIQPDSYLNEYSDTAWPDFGVDTGYLTPNGFTAAQQMGAFYGAYFRDAGLLPATGCPKPKSIWLHADNSQRTYETAIALRNGMFPGCAYQVRHLPIDPPTPVADPLIDPVAAGICTPNDNRSDTAYEATPAASSEAVANANIYSLQDLQGVLNCCQATLCAKAGLAPGCTLLDLSPDEAIGAATNLSEIFLMEYATNMSAPNVGWGRVTSVSQLSFINAVHALEFSAGNADAYDSRVYGSNIINLVLKRFKQATKGKGKKVSVIVGHDNNILNLAGMFGLNWLLDDYQQNQVPPGAGLTFELWHNTKTGKRFVAVNFWAQSPDQLRSATPLSLNTPPKYAALSGAICGSTSTRNGCPQADFTAVASQALYKPCIGNKPK